MSKKTQKNNLDVFKSLRFSLEKEENKEKSMSLDL
jgi:hypothetical protein